MKPTTRKIIIAVSIAALVGLIVWYFWLKPKQDQATIDALGNKTGGATDSLKNIISQGSTAVKQLSHSYTPVTAFDAEHPISHGMSGSQIAQLQKFLNTKYGANITVDGLWWDGTQDALIKAAFPVKDQPGRIYTVLTKSLYDQLGLSAY